MSKKYITIVQADKLLKEIKTKYKPPINSHSGQPLLQFPDIDLKPIFGSRKRMDAEELTTIICRIINKIEKITK